MHPFAPTQSAPLWHWQARPVWRSILAAATALVVLALAGAQNEITLTVLPAAAAITGLAADEYDLHRRATDQTPLGHLRCTAILGSTVLVVALVVFSAT